MDKEENVLWYSPDGGHTRFCNKPPITQYFESLGEAVPGYFTFRAKDAPDSFDWVLDDEDDEEGYEEEYEEEDGEMDEQGEEQEILQRAGSGSSSKGIAVGGHPDRGFSPLVRSRLHYPHLMLHFFHFSGSELGESAAGSQNACRINCDAADLLSTSTRFLFA